MLFNFLAWSIDTDSTVSIFYFLKKMCIIIIVTICFYLVTTLKRYIIPPKQIHSNGGKKWTFRVPCRQNFCKWILEDYKCLQTRIYMILPKLSFLSEKGFHWKMSINMQLLFKTFFVKINILYLVESTTMKKWQFCKTFIFW